MDPFIKIIFTMWPITRGHHINGYAKKKKKPLWVLELPQSTASELGL